MYHILFDHSFFQFWLAENLILEMHLIFLEINIKLPQQQMEFVVLLLYKFVMPM